MTRITARMGGLLLALMAAASGSGCATMIDASDGPEPFGGVRLTASWLRHDGDPKATSSSNIGVPLLFDLPLSLAADTAMLPVTLPRRCARREDDAGAGDR